MLKRTVNAALGRLGLRLCRADTIPMLQNQLADARQAAARAQMMATVTAPTVYGHKVLFDPLDLGMNLSAFGAQEPAGEAGYIARSLRPGQTVLDIGANVGTIALLMARAVGPGGRVYAFEPGPRAFQFLAMNVNLNGYDNITLENMAVSDRVGDTTLQVCRTGESDNRLAGVAAADDALTVRVRTTTVDAYLAGRPVDFIKLDVQGSEFRVLSGMRATVAANPSLAIVMEYGPGWLRAAGVSPQDFFGLIESLNLSMFDLDADGTQQAVTPEWLASNIDGAKRPESDLVLRRA